MGALSDIEWTTHTFNPWWGCTKVGPGCDHCYAETFDKRVGGSHWGSGAPRRLVKDWSGPRKWNRAAEQTGESPWVFCASMADVFDNEVPAEWRARLWDLVRECQSLRWQFVTKRIGNAAKMLPADWAENFGHCGLIATIVNQEEAERDIPKLLRTPAAWRGLSMEPLLGPVDLSPWTTAPANYLAYCDAVGGPAPTGVMKLEWVIIGGESGGKAREYHLPWAESIIAQCAEADVPCFHKQLGDHPTAILEPPSGVAPYRGRVRMSRKGKDMEEWAPALRVRQMPRVYASALPASAGRD